MKNANRSQLIAISLAIMAITLALPRAHAAPASPPGPSVTVANTTTDPVPVVQQGTTTVSGSVSITGTPTVNVANFPAGSGTVNVSSTPNAPLFVRDVDNGRQPFQQSITGRSTGDGVQATFDVVPAGKRLVIEFVSALMSLPTGQKIAFAAVSGNNAHYLTFSPLSTLNGEDRFVISQPMRLYLNAGENPVVFFTRAAITGDVKIDASISGYLIDAP